MPVSTETPFGGSPLDNTGGGFTSAVTLAKTVDQPNAVYQAQWEDWKLIRALMTSTRAMQSGREKWLPMMPKEEIDAYEVRLRQSFLYPALREAVKTAVSKPLSKPIKLTEDSPEDVKAWAENIDYRGSSLDRFSRAWLTDAMAMGMSHVLVSYPQTKGVIGSRGDELAQQIRPYFVHVPAMSMLAAYTSTESGVPILEHCRIMESGIGLKPDRTGEDDFTEINVQRVRVLERGKWMLYEQQSGGWKKIDGGVLDPPNIPLVTLYAGDQLGDYYVRPYFLDLAYKNLEMWQLASHYNNALIQACFAMLAYRGGDARTSEGEVEIAVSPKAVLVGPQDSLWYYVEPSGGGTQQAAARLDTMMQEMAAMAMRPLQRVEAGTVTATARAIEEGNANTEIQAITIAAKDALEQAFNYALGYSGGSQDKVGVDINQDFLPVDQTGGADSLIKMKAMNDLSRKTLWEEMRRRGVLREDFDPDEEDSRIQEELANGMETMASEGFGQAGQAGQGRTSVPPVPREQMAAAKGGGGA